MIPCVWYVSGTALPLEKAVVANMASAFRARGGKVALYIDGGMGGVEPDGAYAWRALTGTERAGRILFPGGALWHLWGDAPLWWGLVRLRSRTAHTVFAEKNPTDKSKSKSKIPGKISDNISWKGYPSRLFPDTAREGEGVLVPAFDSRVSDNALSGPHVAGPGPFDALRAASMTMRGLVTVGLSSPCLDGILGPEGYFHVQEDTEDAWREAMGAAESEEGRRRAASARHHIKTRCSADQCADSLIALYRKVLGGKAE